MSSGDTAIIRNSMLFATDGPNFPDWEFSTIFGFDRSEVRAIANSLSSQAPVTTETIRAVASTFNNLSGYPGGREYWAEFVPSSWPEALSAFERWRNEHQAAA